MINCSAIREVAARKSDKQNLHGNRQRLRLNSSPRSSIIRSLPVCSPLRKKSPTLLIAEIALTGAVVEIPMKNFSLPIRAGDLYGLVSASTVNHHDPTGPYQLVKRASDILFFVVGDDEGCYVCNHYQAATCWDRRLVAPHSSDISRYSSSNRRAIPGQVNRSRA